jgi:16S rRNA (cytidine1402-2'-O)-methyltransferase
MNKDGSLFICPTPIGNLKDITIRTLETLKDVDYIVCEDTRRALKLLNTYEIKKPLMTFNEYNKLYVSKKIILLLKSGHNVAFTCDAGMPVIADSGINLINDCLKSNIKVEVLPGPSAIITALVGSGIDCKNFIFLNFMQRKKNKIIKLLESVKEINFTACAFESPFRLLKTLDIMYNFDSKIFICVCREMTKIHEEFYFGKIQDVIEHYKNRAIKGEITIVFKFQEETNEE